MKLIPLTQGQFAMVDDEDYEGVAQFKWYAKRYPRTWYAMRGTGKDVNGSVIILRMHHFILGSRNMVDHRDHDGLNNQKFNLRHCTQAQNLQNTIAPRNNKSGYKGVYQHSNGKAWIANISSGDKCKYLGIFYDPVEAAKAYDRAAIEKWGEFANPNFKCL